MNAHHTDIAAVSVGGFAGLGSFIHAIEPLLADVSYLLAIIVAGVTIYYKIKNRGQ